MATPTYTLLIVEDFPADREQYRRCLITDPSCTYCLLEAESVEEGLELCRTQAIDAVLLNYMLLDADGLEFIRLLLAQSNGNSPPVVMLAGEGDERVAVQAIKMGAEDYLVKRDLTPKLLQSTLRSAIENTRLRLQLKQCRERFQISVDNMLDCFGIYSAIRDEAGQITDFRFDYLNTAALESNQMTAADIGKMLCEVFPAVRETGLFEEYCRVVETGESLIKEDLVYSDDFGGQRLTRAYDVRISKSDDGFVASWRDVTARKQTELRRQETSQEITTIWESMTDAYITLDRNWRIVYANQAAAQVIFQLTDREPEAFLGRTHWEVFPWSVGQAVEHEYRRAVEEQTAVHFEVLHESTGNWFEVHAYPSAEGLGVYFRDISERKRIEADRLKVTEERDRFFNLSLDMLAIANFEGYFIRLNPAWEQTLGFTPKELTAQPYLDLVHPDDHAVTLAAAQGLNTGQVAINFENRYRCKDGSYRWLSWSAMPYSEQNLVYAIAHDITEGKKTLAALQERNQELNSFVHIVSHDLKAPLRAITNLSQWIEEDLDERLSAECQDNMTLLRSRVHRMEVMIDGLLEYARIGRTAATIEPVVVKELLAEVIDSIAPPPTFHIHLAPNLPTLHTKRLWLYQVFANLIGNGVKHHNLLNGCIRISCHALGDFYEFVVADDGPGIAPEYHDKIFMIFQVGSTQDSQDSSGIGLSIVKKIVETERGTIRLESELGKGTTFYFTWPKH